MNIKMLIAVATGEIGHTNNGLCPDMVAGYDSRDPDCLACRIIMEAEREKQEPVGHQALFDAIAAAAFTPYPKAVSVSVKAFTDKMGSIYTAPPVTAPVRLTYEQIIAATSETVGYFAPHIRVCISRAIETAVLRANGFKIDHPEHALELVGLRGCNSRHGGARKPEPCIYRMRSTDPGCTGCAERDEDQAAEAGDSIKGEKK